MLKFENDSIDDYTETTTGNMIECDNLVKIYKTDQTEVMALQGLDMTVARGELMAIVGNSGSGKSTLLNMLGGLDKPTAGKLHVNGRDLSAFEERDFIAYKRETVGFVWQNNARNLIPYLTAAQNVELPMIFSGKRAHSRALELLDMVGLSHRRNSRLDQMSGGEQQRVAIAIALSNSPKLLLADEPTGSVDTKTAAMILDIFREFNRTLGITVVIVTHDLRLAREVDRVVAIRDGRTSSESVRRRSYAEEIAKLGDTLHRAQPPDAAEQAHDELSVLDRAGRLALPKDYMDSLQLKGGDKVKVELEEEKICIYKYVQ